MAENPPTRPIDSPAGAGGLRAERVSFQYPQNANGIHPFTRNIPAGAFVHLCGPSGCGKSTLVRCLTGLIPHLYHGTFCGQVWLNGLLTTETPLWQLAEHAGMVFQNPATQLLAASVEDEVLFGLENLGLPSAEITRRLEAALERFGLRELLRRSPYSLSGGEQQKLALACITARQPAILALDEPLSMLDGTAATELLAHLQELASEGHTVIVSEHRRDYLQQVPDLCTIELAAPSADVPEAGKPTPLYPQATPAFTLRVERLTVELGGRPILNELSFSARGGEVVAIVGRNGVGKTTLLRALAGLQKGRGRILVDDAERPDFGMVFQNADLQLFNASVQEEVLYKLPDPDQRLLADTLKSLGLSSYAQTPPLLLSEGEKKRVALACVLLRAPRHGVLLDEPSLGQDAAHKTLLLRLSRRLAAAGRLVLLTTHDLPLAAQADRLLLLAAEGIVADGRPGQVLRQSDAWAQLGLSVPAWLPLPPAGEGEA